MGSRGVKGYIHGWKMLFTEAQGTVLAQSTPSFLPPFSGCKIIKDFLSSVTLCVPQNPSISALNLVDMSFQGTGWRTNCGNTEMRRPSTFHPTHPWRILLPLSLVHWALGQAWVHPTACYRPGAPEGVSTDLCKHGGEARVWGFVSGQRLPGWLGTLSL